MPSFSVVVCSSPEHAGAATHLTCQRVGMAVAAALPGLAAHVMNEVAGGGLDANGDGWPVQGGHSDPAFSRNVQPLTVIMTMRPRYRGVDFGLRRNDLHDKLRQRIWEIIQGVRREHERFVDVGGYPYTFSLRIEFVDACGSNVLGDGQVTGEYGSTTEITQLVID